MTGGTWTLTTALAATGSREFGGGAITLPQSVSQSQSQSLPFGTVTGYMSIPCVVKRGLAAGASETLDLYDGSILDIYDDPATFRSLRGFACWVYSGGDSAGVSVGGAASNPHPLFFADTSDKQIVYPSGPAASGGSPAGVAVTATSRNVKITNNGAVRVNYILLLVGTAHNGGELIGMLGLTYP